MRLKVLGMLMLSAGVSVNAMARELPPPVDLSRAIAFGDLPHDCDASAVLDGDEESHWTSHDHDLSETPANVFITLAEPVDAGLMEVVVPLHPEPEKYPLRIANMDVYARVYNGWAKIGAVRNNDQQPRFFIELKPSRVRQLRLRVYPRSETVTQWAQIAQVRLYPLAESVEPVELEAEPVDESEIERLGMLRAFGYARAMMAPGGIELSRIPAHPATFNAEWGYLGYVQRWFEIMGTYGTDRYGEIVAVKEVEIDMVGFETCERIEEIRANIIRSQPFAVSVWMSSFGNNNDAISICTVSHPITDTPF